MPGVQPTKVVVLEDSASICSSAMVRQYSVMLSNWREWGGWLLVARRHLVKGGKGAFPDPPPPTVKVAVDNRQRQNNL